MSARLGRVLAHTRGARGAIAILDHAGAWGRRNFARWMFEDEPRAIAAHAVALAPPRARRRRARSPFDGVTPAVRGRPSATVAP